MNIYKNKVNMKYLKYKDDHFCLVLMADERANRLSYYIHANQIEYEPDRQLDFFNHHFWLLNQEVIFDSSKENYI